MISWEKLFPLIVFVRDDGDDAKVSPFDHIIRSALHTLRPVSSQQPGRILQGFELELILFHWFNVVKLFILSWQQNNWPHLFIPLLYPVSLVSVGYLFQCNNVKLTSESCQSLYFLFSCLVLTGIGVQLCSIIIAVHIHYCCNILMILTLRYSAATRSSQILHFFLTSQSAASSELLPHCTNTFILNLKFSSKTWWTGSCVWI